MTRPFYHIDASTLSLFDEIDRLPTIPLLDMVAALADAPPEMQEVGWTRYEIASCCLLYRVQQVQNISASDAWLVLRLSGYRLAFDRPPQERAA